MDEFQLIGRIREMCGTPQGVTGIGDDCAIIPQASGMDSLVSTDMLVEGVHFLRSDIDPYRLGWKSAAVNISDIAAMGGRPIGSFLAFALPKDIDSQWVEKFMAGYGDISAQYSCPLLGGDTTSSVSGISICVTVLGSCPSGKALRRSAARAGDLICTTGHIGDSAAGLRIILEHKDRGELENILIDRHYRPNPCVEEGLALAAHDGVHAAMDISDGIGSDLRHILEESHMAARIDTLNLPISDELRAACDKYGWDPADLALDGGEDYQLLFTISPEKEKYLKINHFIIGEILAPSPILPAGHILWTPSSRPHTGFHHEL